MISAFQACQSAMPGVQILSPIKLILVLKKKKLVEIVFLILRKYALGKEIKDQFPYPPLKSFLSQ